MLPAGAKRRRAVVTSESDSTKLTTVVEEEEMDPSFKTVEARKCVKQSKLNIIYNQKMEPIETSNKFNVLPDETPKYKPTPIIVNKTFGNHEQLVSKLKMSAPKGFRIKYNTNSTSIYVDDLEDKKNLKNQLTADKINYFTFTEKTEKTHAFVLKGLEGNPDIDDIKNELEAKNVPVKSLYLMKNTFRPLYLVITSQKISLTFLEKNIKFLSYTKIFWQRYINKKLIIQCHNCQQWGHATSNCYSTVKCLKCADNHLTRDCKKTEDTPAKCANCSGNHPANSTTCPTYRSKMTQMKRNGPTTSAPERKYIAAPVPAASPWKTKQTSVSQNEHYNTNYPLLPNKTTILTQKQTPIYSTQNTSSINEFTQITQEINTLNTHINISKFLLHLKNLNKHMNNLQTKQEKALLFLEFTQQLNTLDI